MGRRNVILIVLLFLVVSLLVGFGAFQAGLHAGADGRIGPGQGYYERGYAYPGWGFFPFGFLFPLLFVLLIILLVRGLFWHRPWGGPGYCGPAYWRPGACPGPEGEQTPGGGTHGYHWPPHDPPSTATGYYDPSGRSARPQEGPVSGTPGAEEQGTSQGEPAAPRAEEPPRG